MQALHGSGYTCLLMRSSVSHISNWNCELHILLLNGGLHNPVATGKHDFHETARCCYDLHVLQVLLSPGISGESRQSRAPLSPLNARAKTNSKHFREPQSHKIESKGLSLNLIAPISRCIRTLEAEKADCK
jgi:hypothetical protein